MKSWIEDEEYDGERVLSREFDTLMMDFIEPYADRLGIEYCYDDYWRMHITKIEKVGTNPHWIAGSEIAVIRKDKNQIFIICCQPVVKCAGSFLQIIIIYAFNSALHLPLEIHKTIFIMQPL